MKVVIFPSDDGGVCVLSPAYNNALNAAGEWIALRTVNDPLPGGFRLCTIEDIAKRDVPPGRPFEIIDAEDLPDRSTRQAWEWS